MLIIENQLDVAKVELFKEEADQRFSILSKTFSKDDITKIVENLVKTDEELAVYIGSLNEGIQLNEFIVKHVSSKGEITKTKDRKTRTQQAQQTTGLSKAKRRQIAIKAAKTKRANPSGEIKRKKKFKKALKKRAQLNLD